MTSLKAQRIARSPRLSSLLSPTPSEKPQVLHGGQGLTSPRYTLLPLDLRTDSLDDVLPYLDTTLPTLFLAECVLCYMTPEQGEDVIRWFGSTFERCMGVIYEMCGLEDQFGRVMRRNLAVSLCTYLDSWAMWCRGFADWVYRAGTCLCQELSILLLHHKRSGSGLNG